MKNTIAKLLGFVFLLLLVYPCAVSQESPLTGLTIKDGWVHGIAPACFGFGTNYETHGEVIVDFPLPTEAYPAEILTVGNRSVSKKEMQKALKAADQSTQGKFVNPRGSAHYTGDWNAEARADISKEAAASQAVDIALRYFKALGIEVDPIPYAISRPYDYEAYMERQTEYYQHRFSDASTFMEKAKAAWSRQEKYHPQQSEYTCLSFYILLDGMKLSSFTDYPAGYADEPEAKIGFSVSADAKVSDSGILVEASCPLFEIKKRRPLTADPAYEDHIRRFAQDYNAQAIPGEDWQQALTSYLSNLQAKPFNDEQAYQNQYMPTPVIQYASKTVITALEPVLYTVSEDEWAPFWKIETKNEFSNGWRD